MVDAETPWWLLVLPSLIGIVAGVGGVWIGHHFTRGRELRAVRLAAYSAWVGAARSMASWVGPEPEPPPPGQTVHITFPPAERLRAFNDATATLGLVASDDVIKTARDFRERMFAYFSSVGVQQLQTVRDAVDPYDKALAPYRHDVVTAMRRDLIGWRAARRADTELTKD